MEVAMNQLFAKTTNNLQKPKEGDLYKVIVAHGKQFEIYYGFYEEIDRQNPLAEPMEIYPNFAKHPQYTRDGFAFATAMQTPCKHFLLGRGQDDVDNTCMHCQHYTACEELLGVCKCKHNKKQI